MAGLAGGDDETGARGIGEIENAAIAAGLGARQRRVLRRIEAAAAIQRIEIAARRERQVAPAVEARHVAENLVPDERRLFRAPAPFAHVGALIGDDARQRAVE